MKQSGGFWDEMEFWQLGILWVGANTGSAGSVLSLGSSKWMRNQEDQSKDYQ
ncbi:hypothetical protein HID58_079716, partial [Brassica napus]